jgi:anti-anti-sigma factor
VGCVMRREPKIKVHEGSNAVTIDIKGDLTDSAAKEMDAAYQEACGYSPGNILLNFHEKSHINSSGLAIIINMLIESKDKGDRIFVSGLTKHYRKIFEISGLNKYTTIVESEDEIAGAEEDE